MTYSTTVSKSLDENLETMQYIFHTEKNKDIIIREFAAGNGTRCFLICMDGMSDSSTIGELILRPLLLAKEKKLDVLQAVQVNSCEKTTQIPDVTASVLNGDTGIFVEGAPDCILCETKGFETRSIGSPTTENVIKGSQEAFNESIRTNITMIRRFLKSSHLCTEFITVGDINKNQCALMYVDNIVNKETLRAVRKRMGEIKGDFIMGSGMIEQLIEDSSFSIFPSTLSTERPDRTAAYLSSGRIAVVCDGSPFVTIVPITLFLLLDSPEGNMQRWQAGSYHNIVKLFALFFTTMVSGIYLALINYHQEMVPTQLMGAIVNARANIPFPSIVEVLMMELFFDLIRTAGLRIPRALGGAIGIVGALILGQSAVEAHLVSPVTLIVVALGGIGNSALPDYDLAFSIRVVKLGFIFLGAFLGFLGIVIGLIIVVTTLVNQTSFGVPMLSFQGAKWSTGGPFFMQLPVWKQHSRPRELKPQKDRQTPGISRQWEVDGTKGRS